MISSDDPSFIYDVSNLCLSVFFLDCIARSLSLVLFFQIASFWFYWFFSFHFLFSVWLIFAFLLFIFSVCFILNCSSFSSFLKWKFRWLILDLSSLLICAFSAIFNTLVWLHHTNFGFLFSLSFSSLSFKIYIMTWPMYYLK